jgi:hypothetical protein
MKLAGDLEKWTSVMCRITLLFFIGAVCYCAQVRENSASDLGFEDLVREGQKADKKPSSFSVNQFPNELFNIEGLHPLGDCRRQHF